MAKNLFAQVDRKKSAMINKYVAKIKKRCDHKTAFKTSFGQPYCPKCEKNITMEEFKQLENLTT